MVQGYGHGSSPFTVLTPRERDVMDYVVSGKPNKIIAAELGVSQRTVEAHRARIFQKMQVRNAVELTRCLLTQHTAS
ncbi:MAG TPA: LuxR C-terminal-related transcriptional regulator [Candidimonas sp.]|nr:LuxR C-terminal-related transcriptional regulator [Candidimonas sp.]